MSKQTEIGRLVVLLEVDGKLRQALITALQESIIKDVLANGKRPIQVLDKELGIEIDR